MVATILKFYLPFTHEPQSGIVGSTQYFKAFVFVFVFSDLLIL